MYVPYIPCDLVALAYLRIKWVQLTLLCYHGCWLLDELGWEQRSNCKAVLCLCGRADGYS